MMEKHSDGIELCYAETKEIWRDWLEKNHDKAKSVWLVYYKKESGKTRVSYDDAVDEAICFGWIDSKPNKLDELRSIQFFAPRNPKSNWSKVNKERVERLISEGKMTASGLKVIELAKANGAWDALNEVEAMVIPEDLLQALAQEPLAHDYFMAFPKSSKKNILEWLYNAKTPETRNKRIFETVTLAKENIRANHFRQPKGK
jgi:uncharacterized protein YdeI (YjbR/CyaY-like superfamily)